MKLSPALLALLFALAGVTAPVAAADASERVHPDAASPASTQAAAAGSQAAADRRPDPPTDVLGWENGYWHNESIDVDQSDGLSDAELEAYVARSMARVEFIREREFTESVPVTVVSREEYRNRSASRIRHGEYGEWNNQVWEGLFIVGEEPDVQTEISSTIGTSVLGFYSPPNDEIRIVSDSPESLTINNATLVHELVHALQDQHYNLSDPTYAPPTQDGDLATSGLIEGTANYVEAQYSQRCGAAWSCVETPAGERSRGGSGPNLGILLTLLQPYSDGPVYVDDLYRREGWEGIDEAYRSPPVSSEQTIHLTSERPRPISYTDRAEGEWEMYPSQGQNGSDTVGEASIYVMFWYQARNYGADTVNPSDLFDADGEYDLYNYDAEPSNGWANDRLFPYQRETESGEADSYGYVWVTEWDTRTDAREFERAYHAILSAHDARQRSDGIFVVERGPWADSFRVVRNGTRVTIVNGPTPEDVNALRPSLAPAPAPTSTAATPAEERTSVIQERRDTDVAATPGGTSGESGDANRSTATAETRVPGFGIAAGALALVLAVGGALALRGRL
jgi:hypothetical protein